MEHSTLAFDNEEDTLTHSQNALTFMTSYNLSILKYEV